MEDLVKIKNRSNGAAGYELKDKNIVRIFEPMEIKKVSKDELRSLSYQRGGKKLLQDYLQVISDDKEFLEEILGTNIEPEYNYSKDDVINIMLNGSLEKFLDLLDFAPIAVLEIVKTESVKLELNDVSKRKAIKEKTGFDVDMALRNLALQRQEEEKERLKDNGESKSKPKVETSAKERRVKEIPKYEIVG